MLFYPHADDENVAMGYANYSHTEEKTMVTIGKNAFKTYMFANYLGKLDRDSLLDILDSRMDLKTLIDMAQNIWDLPFEFTDGKIELIDANALLLKHSQTEHSEDFTTWESEDDEYAPYDELDENLEEIEDEEA